MSGILFGAGLATVAKNAQCTHNLIMSYIFVLHNNKAPAKTVECELQSFHGREDQEKPSHAEEGARGGDQEARGAGGDAPGGLRRRAPGALGNKGGGVSGVGLGQRATQALGMGRLKRYGSCVRVRGTAWWLMQRRASDCARF